MKGSAIGSRPIRDACSGQESQQQERGREVRLHGDLPSELGRGRPRPPPSRLPGRGVLELGTGGPYAPSAAQTSSRPPGSKKSRWPASWRNGGGNCETSSTNRPEFRRTTPPPGMITCACWPVIVPV